jgi:hypothetical protein
VRPEEAQSTRPDRAARPATSVAASGSTATLQPSANLQPSKTYTATLLSGPNGIEHLAGNALASDYTWSFTTEIVDVTPPSSAVASRPPPAIQRRRLDGRLYVNGDLWSVGAPPTAERACRGWRVSIRRVSTNRWWTGSGYTSTTERWFVAAGTTSWKYALASWTLLGPGSYAVRVRATDNSGNVKSPFRSPTSGMIASGLAGSGDRPAPTRLPPAYSLERSRAGTVSRRIWKSSHKDQFSM